MSLNFREYAIYHVLVDDAQVSDFPIDPVTQKLSLRSKTHEGIGKGVMPAKPIWEALPGIYSGDGAA